MAFENLISASLFPSAISHGVVGYLQFPVEKSTDGKATRGQGHKGTRPQGTNLWPRGLVAFEKLH
jgi:hypothetical protein